MYAKVLYTKGTCVLALKLGAKKFQFQENNTFPICSFYSISLLRQCRQFCKKLIRVFKISQLPRVTTQITDLSCYKVFPGQEQTHLKMTQQNLRLIDLPLSLLTGETVGFFKPLENNEPLQTDKSTTVFCITMCIQDRLRVPWTIFVCGKCPSFIFSFGLLEFLEFVMPIKTRGERKSLITGSTLSCHFKGGPSLPFRFFMTFIDVFNNLFSSWNGQCGSGVVLVVPWEIEQRTRQGNRWGKGETDREKVEGISRVQSY